jgi:hypothetical protein
MSELTPDRFIEDAHALTVYLQQRFISKKIYVYGVSWTSILGVWLVQPPILSCIMPISAMARW